MRITIGRIVSHSKGGRQYGVMFYTDGDSDSQTLKFEIDDHLNDGDYVLGELLKEDSPQRFVFHYTDRFAPDDVNSWLTAFSIDLENGRNPLIPDIISTFFEQLKSILSFGEDRIPLVRMVLKDGCNHIDSLSDIERSLVKISYQALCNHLPKEKDKPKELVIDIALCVQLINNAWDKEWFSSEKDYLLKAHMLDEQINSVKDAIKEIDLLGDDSMAVFYSRRINVIAAFNDAECSLRSFIIQIRFFPHVSFDCGKFLSSDAKHIIESILNKGPAIRKLIKDYPLDEIKQYIEGHQEEWDNYCGTDLVQRLTRESSASRIDFIRATYSRANKSIREAYLNLLLKTEIDTILLDDYMAITQNIYADDLKLDEDINETQAKAVCRYFCEKNVDSRISHLAKKLWPFVRKQDLSFDEQIVFLKCGLLDKKTFISSSRKMRNNELLALWQSCRNKDADGKLEILNEALRDCEDHWTDWNSGIELYGKGVFKQIPFGLLFRPGTPKETIASELFKLKPAEYIDYLESYQERKLATDVAALLWSRELKKGTFRQSAASIDTEVYQSRYSSMPDNEVFIGLLKDWAGHERKSLESFIANALRDSIDESITKGIKALFGQDRYVSHSEVKRFICEHRQYFDNLQIALKIGLRELITAPHAAEICDDLMLTKHKEISNRRFITRHLSEPLAIRGHELIEEQKRAVICDEDNTLVVNSAGGGKSTLIEAKTRYLINTSKVPPEDILILTFNKSVAEELASKMKDVGVECGTFHAIAQGILAQNYGNRPSFFEPKDGLAVYFDLMSTDSQFKRVVSDYAISTSYDGLKAPYEYETEKDYKDAVIEYNSKYRGKCLDKLFPKYKDMDGRMVVCKSDQECKICDFLGSHGIAFKYEHYYEYEIPNPERKRYQPDFAVYNQQGDKTPLLYIEHIGINKDGKCAAGIDQKAYEEKRVWAQGIHKKYKTILLETTGAEFDDRSVFSKLAHKLEEHGIDLSKTVDPPYSNCDSPEIGNFCVSYVSLMKSSCQSFSDIRKKVQSKDDLYFLDKMIGRYLEEYERIKKGDNKVDFDDAILEATELLNNGTVQQTYKYILIDEFQDISIARHRFVKALRDSETKLFCVGDDWQSIYRFSGSDLSLFADFERHTGYTSKIEAGTTFRFGNPAMDASSKFISSKMSCDKKVKQHDENKVTEIELVSYKDDPVSRIESILDNVLFEDSGNGNNEMRIPKVIFLARNNPGKDEAFNFFDKSIRKICKEDKKYFVSYRGKEIPFYSIHAAKGLEAENVIVLNCNEGKFGIPSRISDSPLLRYVLSKREDCPDAEERRLFYVALTRATAKTWLLYEEKRPSPYVMEIKEIQGKK